jgi:hypothetical protein
MPPAANHTVINALQEQIRSLEGGNARRQEALPFGIDELDRRLPQGGLVLGALHEVAGGAAARSMERPRRFSRQELLRERGVRCCGV